ncbi:MAG: transcription antitermination factor NusB [Clostridiales bacterium]|nr:transcription antitermination factor NusB [Clostridiales bacterium]
MSRVSAREVLMKLLYERDIAGEHHNESFEKLSDEFQLDMNDEEYVKKILFSMDAEQGKIDDYIRKYAKDWTVDRMARVDLAIIRLALYEVLYMEDIPISVSINEAVELAKKYGNEKSSSFVNGILGNFIRTEPIKTRKNDEE